MEVHVYSISVPAMSAIGYGFEVGTGDKVYFSGDHRAMRDLGNALQLDEESPVALLELWQVVCKIPFKTHNDRKEIIP